MTAKPLTFAQKQFVHELITDPTRNATAAYQRAFPLAAYNSARAESCELMKNPRVVAYLERQERELRDSAHLTASQVLTHIAELTNADSRDLCDFWRGCCRYCWGHEHMYQRRPQEYRDAVEQYARVHAKDDPMCLAFPMLGGVGYNSTREANPACPECDGVGVGHTRVKDLRDIPRSAARLIRSIKETKDGFEIKTRDQDKMVDLASKHLGLVGTREGGGGDDIPPAATVSYVAEDGKV